MDKQYKRDPVGIYNAFKLTMFNYKQDNVQANLESVQCRVFQICKVFD